MTIADHSPSVLVIDDDENFVNSMVAVFKQRKVAAHGLSDIGEVFRAARNGTFAKYDITFIDMRLGKLNNKDVTAADVLLQAKTYTPNAKIIVFTQKGISVEECVRCIQWGALGIFPKTSEPEHFDLVARVYPHVGNPTEVRETLICEVWKELSLTGKGEGGRLLEMLMINLFNSIVGFSVIENNVEHAAGELDVVIANSCEHEFWKSLNSHHLIVECKSGTDRSEKEVFNILSEKVRKKRLCKVGIVVSLAGATKGFRTLQSTSYEDDVLIFAMHQQELSELVRLKFSERERYLRNIFEKQI